MPKTLGLGSALKVGTHINGRHASNWRHASYSRKPTIARTPAKARMTEEAIGISTDASSIKGNVSETPTARSLYHNKMP
jgi:hypothetical protein